MSKTPSDQKMHDADSPADKAEKKPRIISSRGSIVPWEEYLEEINEYWRENEERIKKRNELRKKRLEATIHPPPL
jgi:hypothetical protein